VSWKKLDAFGLEYRFLSRYLRGQLTKAEAVTQLKYAIQHFAKRQMTWWKRDHDIHWVVPSQAERLVTTFLRG
jgi:tRNA dimethylallyltransferase